MCVVCLYTVPDTYPKNLQLLTINSSSIFFIWDWELCPRIVGSYRINMLIANDCYSQQVNSTITDFEIDPAGGKASYVLTGLHPFTNYCINVTAINPWGESEASPFLCNSTLAAGMHMQ